MEMQIEKQENIDTWLGRWCWSGLTNANKFALTHMTTIFWYCRVSTKLTSFAILNWNVFVVDSWELPSNNMPQWNVQTNFINYVSGNFGRD